MIQGSFRSLWSIIRTKSLITIVPGLFPTITVKVKECSLGTATHPMEFVRVTVKVRDDNLCQESFAPAGERSLESVTWRVSRDEIRGEEWKIYD